MSETRMAVMEQGAAEVQTLPTPELSPAEQETFSELVAQLNRLPETNPPMAEHLNAQRVTKKSGKNDGFGKPA